MTAATRVASVRKRAAGGTWKCAIEFVPFLQIWLPGFQIFDDVKVKAESQSSVSEYTCHIRTRQIILQDAFQVKCRRLPRPLSFRCSTYTALHFNLVYSPIAKQSYFFFFFAMYWINSLATFWWDVYFMCFVWTKKIRIFFVALWWHSIQIVIPNFDEKMCC